ncbi:MAG: hypothetical protein V3V10_09365, partial [Planctomycetota bacterium]
MTTAKEKLEERLQTRKESFHASNEKWDEVLAQWIAELDELFVKLDGWLQPLQDKDLIRIEVASKEIQEEDLDPYEAPVRKISDPAGARLHIQPVGRFIFGAQGRVDFLSG